MKSRLLDQKTLGAVIAASPAVEWQIRDLGKLAVEWIDSRVHAEKLKTRDGTGYWQAKISDLAEYLKVSPAQAAVVLRELGLTTLRKRDGTYFMWSVKQFSLLWSAVIDGSVDLRGLK